MGRPSFDPVGHCVGINLDAQRIHHHRGHAAAVNCPHFQQTESFQFAKRPQ
jgi:hypothetical protein